MVSRSRANRSLVDRGAHSRAPRSRRILRRGRGARGSVAPLATARRGWRPARAWRRRDRELRRAPLRDPVRDERGRSPAPLSGGRLRPAAPQPLPAVLERGLGGGRRRGAARRADGTRRGVPRPRQRPHVVRRRTPARRGGAGRRPRCDLALLLPRRLDGEGGVQDRVGPAEAGRHHGRPAGDRGAVPRAAPDPPAPRRRPSL